MKTLSERIKQSRAATGMSQAELAEKVGVKQQTIQKIESGKSESTRYLVSLAKALGVDPVWLASGYEGASGSGIQKVVSGETKEEGARIEDISRDVLQAAVQMHQNYVLVPRYDVTASMGHGILVHSEQVVDHLAFQRSWIETDLDLKPEDLVLVKSRGDSMMPTISPGELLLVDTSTQEVHDGQIYVLSFDGDLLAKRIQKTPTGGIVITSDNSKYESFHVPHDEAVNLRIIGRVVWAGRRM